MKELNLFFFALYCALAATVLFWEWRQHAARRKLRREYGDE